MLLLVGGARRGDGRPQSDIDAVTDCPETPVLRNLTTCVLLLAAFVGGYYLGRRPNSPDLVALGKAAYQRAAEVGQSAAGACEQAGGQGQADADAVKDAPSRGARAAGAPIAAVAQQQVIPLDQWGRNQH
jgi:hypothetical protein